MNQIVTIRINTDLDLSLDHLWPELERLIMGYDSPIHHDELLEVEVVKVTAP